MYKLKEAAKILDVSMSFLNKYIKSGQIKVIWIGGVRRISEGEIERIKKEGVPVT